MTIDPFLMCAECATPTLHVFTERRPQARKRGELPYVDCIYECDVCGSQRAWGNEPREETLYGRRFAAEEVAHLLDRHDMRRMPCPTCAGSDLDCPRCDDNGQAWVICKPQPCRPGCLLAAFDPVEDE